MRSWKMRDRGRWKRGVEMGGRSERPEKRGNMKKKREDKGKEKMKKEILFSIFEHFSLLNTYSWNSALGAWRKKERLTEY